MTGFGLTGTSTLIAKTKSAKRSSSKSTSKQSAGISPEGHSYKLQGSERMITLIFNGNNKGTLQWSSSNDTFSSPFNWTQTNNIVCVKDCPVIPAECFTISADGKSMTDKNQIFKRIK